MSLPGLLPELEVIRKDFPILERELAGGKPLVYLDSANTSQKPQVVIDTMVDHLERHNANIARERALEDREVLADHVEIREQSLHRGPPLQVQWWGQVRPWRP